MITGTLEMDEKRVSEIMTHLQDVFMLPYDGIMDFDTVANVFLSGNIIIAHYC